MKKYRLCAYSLGKLVEEYETDSIEKMARCVRLYLANSCLGIDVYIDEKRILYADLYKVFDIKSLDFLSKCSI